MDMDLTLRSHGQLSRHLFCPHCSSRYQKEANKCHEVLVVRNLWTVGKIVNVLQDGVLGIFYQSCVNARSTREETLVPLNRQAARSTYINRQLANLNTTAANVPR